VEFIYTSCNTDSAKGDDVKDEDNSSSSVQRAFSIIRALAATQAKGGRITDIAKATGLTQATTHRILQSLVVERVVEQEAAPSCTA
jgi:DNA-binding MarR family transcriptional regulator